MRFALGLRPFTAWVLVFGFLAAATPVQAAKRCDDNLEDGRGKRSAKRTPSSDKTEAESEDSGAIRERLIKEFTALAKSSGDYPTLSEVAKAAGISTRAAREIIDETELRAQAIEKNRSAFINVRDSRLYNPKTLAKLQADIAKFRRFFVTTAIAGDPLHEQALKAVERWADANNAAVLILPAANRTEFMDPELLDQRIVFEEIDLAPGNPTGIKVQNTGVTGRTINPLTGLARLAAGSNMIVASPKQQLAFSSGRHNGYPYAGVSTGCITTANYETRVVGSARLDRLAEHDHVMGGLILEIAPSGEVLFRHVQFREDGSFVDLVHRHYADKKPTSERPDALVMGDLHDGETDANVRRASFEMIDAVKPRIVVLHDMHNAHTQSHHEIENPTVRAQRAEADQVAWDGEFKANAETLLEFVRRGPEVYVVKSNHDEMVDKAVNSGSYLEQPENTRTGHELAIGMIDKKDPLALGIKKHWKGTEEEWNRIHFLTRNDDLIVGGFQLAAHGDIGTNGTKNPGLPNIERAYGKAVIGHAHSGAMLRGVLRVGTSSRLRLGYNKGASSWTHTHALVYADGSATLIQLPNGTWTINE